MHQGKIGAPRRRRLSHLSNWMRSSGFLHPVSATREKKKHFARSVAKRALGTELCTVHTGNKSQQTLAGWSFTSYGSVLALHQSRSICLTFLALGGSAKEHFWAEAAGGPALQRRGDENSRKSSRCQIS